MLNRTEYFIREHAGFMKLTDVYDILDPDTKTKIGEAREEISGFVKFMRLLIDKSLMPTTIVVYEGGLPADQKRLFSLRRGVRLFNSKVDIADAGGQSLGFLKSKLFSIGGAFRVCTPDGNEIALVKGDWKGWNFRFLSGETELGVITKKWAGLGKEFFTSADNYLIKINGAPAPDINLLLLAAGLAVDTVFKEKR